MVDLILVGLCQFQNLNALAIVANSTSFVVRAEYPDFSSQTEATTFHVAVDECLEWNWNLPPGFGYEFETEFGADFWRVY